MILELNSPDIVIRDTEMETNESDFAKDSRYLRNLCESDKILLSLSWVPIKCHNSKMLNKNPKI